MLKKILLIFLTSTFLIGCQEYTPPVVKTIGVEFETFYNENWGEYSRQAKDLYNSILNTREDVVIIKDFKSEKDVQNFYNEFYYLYGLFPSYVSCYEGSKYKIYYTSKDYETLDLNIDNFEIIDEFVATSTNRTMTEEEMVNSIGFWIIDNYSYLINNPKLSDFIETKEGNCSAYSALFRQMCRAVGIENDIMAGQADGYHAWNRVKIDGNWYYYDLTWADNNDGIVNEQYIMSEIIWESHIFERYWNGLCY